MKQPHYTGFNVENKKQRYCCEKKECISPVSIIFASFLLGLIINLFILSFKFETKTVFLDKTIHIEKTTGKVESVVFIEKQEN